LASEINFDCPKCQASLSAPGQFVGKQIQCPDCGQQVGVPEADSGSDWMLSGLSDEPESDIPDTLKIDGISSDSHGGVSWDITCDVCDSVLLVNLEQVGSKIKCTDCHSLLEVQPPEEQQMLDQIADSSASEPTDDFSVDSVAEEHDELFDDLMLAPAVDLPNEVTELQSENYFGQFDEPELEAEQNESSSQQLHPPLAVPMVAQQDDDDDEMIEVLDVPPEQLNRPKAKKVVKQVSQEADDDDDAPVRVFAKKRRKSKKSSGSDSKSEAQFDFDKASFGEVTDKAVDVLKSPSVMIWAVAATVIMAIGSAIWHGLGVSDLDPETTEMGSRLIQSGVGFLFGHGVFFLGYVILLFVGGVILRETAQGRTQIESVSCTGVPDFIFDVHRCIAVGDDWLDVFDATTTVSVGRNFPVFGVEKSESLYDCFWRHF